VGGGGEGETKQGLPRSKGTRKKTKVDIIKKKKKTRKTHKKALKKKTGRMPL